MEDSYGLFDGGRCTEGAATNAFPGRRAWVFNVVPPLLGSWVTLLRLRGAGAPGAGTPCRVLPLGPRRGRAGAPFRAFAWQAGASSDTSSPVSRDGRGPQ